MNITAQQPLQSLNSFGFVVNAEHYVQVSNDDELLAALATAKKNAWPVFLLGGGSNLVLTQNIEGLVIHPINTTTTYDNQADGSTLVTAGAGKLALS